MDRFNEFVSMQEQPLREHKFKAFLKDNNLMDKWREFKKPKLSTFGDAQGWSENPDRPVAELKQVLQKAVDGTRLVGGNGLMDIDFEVQHKEDVQSGTKLTVEMKGVARAGNKLQVRRLLEDLMHSAKKSLSENGYFLQIQLNTLHVEENKDEELEFLVMGVVVHTPSNK